MKTLEEYEAMLKAHDWYYQMTDDHRVWVEGQESWQEIQRHRNDSPKHVELYIKHYVSIPF